MYFLLEDVFHQFLNTTSTERNSTWKQMIHCYAHWPDVYFLRVLLKDYLGGNKCGGCLLVIAVIGWLIFLLRFRNRWALCYKSFCSKIICSAALYRDGLNLCCEGILRHEALALLFFRRFARDSYFWCCCAQNWVNLHLSITHILVWITFYISKLQAN